MDQKQIENVHVLMYQIWKIVVESLDGNITKILEMSNDRILFVTGVNECSDKKAKVAKRIRTFHLWF